MTQGDDLQPTRNDYSTAVDYSCPNKIVTIVSQTIQTSKTRPIILKSFEIKVEILKVLSSLPKSFEIDQF